MDNILEILYRHQDVAYGDFLAGLVPTLERDAFIGIRSPEYKKIVKEIRNAFRDENGNDCCEEMINDFMNALPHTFHEENVLETIFINEIKDYDLCIDALERFLPYIDNWAVSDGLSPKAFEKNHDRLIGKIKEWIEDPRPYTKRVAMLFIKKYFLEEDFKPEYLEWAARIRSDEYYVNMMTAWLFAEALAKQRDSALEFILDNKLDVWTHNKAIQKARESRRISPEDKVYLNTLKRKHEHNNS